MPADVAVHLHFPTHDKEVVVKKKLKLDGSYHDEKAQIHALLAPGFSHHAGTVKLGEDTRKLLARDLQAVKSDTSEIVHIDAEEGVQIKYRKLENEKGGRWIGIPGRYTYKAQTARDAQELHEGRKPKENHTQQIIMMVVTLASMGLALMMAAIAFG